MSVLRRFLPKVLLLGLVLFMAIVPRVEAEAGAAADPLTSEERAFVTAHGPIRYAPDPLFPPFEFLDSSGVARGITPDLLTLMGKKLGVEFRTVAYLTWSDILEAVKRGKVDLLGTLTRTPEREGFLLFSKPYLSVSYVLFVRQGGFNPNNIEDMVSRRLGVVKNYGINTWLSALHPNLHPVEVEDTATGLTMVATGQLDAMLEALPVGAEIVREESLTNIRIVPRLIETLPQHFGVRKEEALLLSIVQKGLDSLTAPERSEVFVRWSGHDFSRPPPPISPLLRNVLIILVAAAVLSWVWITALRRSVRRAAQSLRESEERYRSLFDKASDGIFVMSHDGKLMEVNESFARMHGYSKEELLQMNISDLDTTKTDHLFSKRMHQLLAGEILSFEVEHNHKDGHVFPLEVSANLISIGGGTCIQSFHRDITERKRSEEHVAGLHKKNELILCSVAEGILGLDLQGCHTFVNSAAARMLGYEVEELLGRHSHSTWHHTKPDGSPYTEEECQICAAYRNGAAHRVSTEVFWSKDGTSFPVEYVSTPIYEQGRLAGAVLTFADITERKQSERTLKESEEKFRLIFEDSKDGIILVDEESKKFQTCNDTFCNMLQYTLDEIRRLGLLDIHPEEDIPWILEEFDRRARKETVKEIDIPVKRKDGSIFWAEVKSSPVTIFGKKYVIGNFRDVTERRKAAVILARLGMAVDQSAEIIVITDREGTIQYVNPAFERITGYSVEEVIGKNPRILHSGKHDESFYREMWGALLRGEVWEGHFSNRKKDGSLYEEDATISPVRDSSGNIVNFVAVKKDVTRLLSLERQVRTAQKMEAVGTLAGGIAHDFNNALTGIVGFGELLRLRMAGDEQALHDLDEILRCAERASTLTRQLLTYARRQIIEPVNLNLSALVEDLMKLIGKVVGEHIEIKTYLEKNISTIHVDRGQIEQVVMNLCLNARDAMPEGGQLTVETEDVVLDEEYVRRNPYMRTGRYALLTVSDTGVGMDEKTRERVFDPFFTTKGPDKGTGLGLAMVYGIVKQHNGFINLYSEPGKGTAFKVYLPAIEAQPDAIPEKRREEIVRGGTETILLAEDEEAIRVLVERTLTELGYTVLVARNGEEAIEIFRQNKEIALAVLDVVMPRKGGKKAFEEMHKANPNLKVIFMSGYTANAIHDSFVLIAGMPFLQKPFGPTILAKKVREVLDAQ